MKAGHRHHADRVFGSPPPPEASLYVDMPGVVYPATFVLLSPAPRKLVCDAGHPFPFPFSLTFGMTKKKNRNLLPWVTQSCIRQAAIYCVPSSFLIFPRDALGIAAPPPPPFSANEKRLGISFSSRAAFPLLLDQEGVSPLF